MSKSPDAFRTISEVADWLGVQAHVLRFWESKFTQIKPVKRAGGRRYYRPADMLLLGGIRKLLYQDGLSIKEVQALLRDLGIGHVSQLSHDLEADGPPKDSSNMVSKPSDRGTIETGDVLPTQNEISTEPVDVPQNLAATPSVADEQHAVQAKTEPPEVEQSTSEPVAPSVDQAPQTVTEIASDQTEASQVSDTHSNDVQPENGRPENNVTSDAADTEINDSPSAPTPQDSETPASQSSPPVMPETPLSAEHLEQEGDSSPIQTAHMLDTSSHEVSPQAQSGTDSTDDASSPEHNQIHQQDASSQAVDSDAEVTIPVEEAVTAPDTDAPQQMFMELDQPSPNSTAPIADTSDFTAPDPIQEPLVHDSETVRPQEISDTAKVGQEDFTAVTDSAVLQNAPLSEATNAPGTDDQADGTAESRLDTAIDTGTAAPLEDESHAEEVLQEDAETPPNADQSPPFSPPSDPLPRVIEVADEDHDAQATLVPGILALLAQTHSVPTSLQAEMANCAAQLRSLVTQH